MKEEKRREKEEGEEGREKEEGEGEKEEGGGREEKGEGGRRREREKEEGGGRDIITSTNQIQAHNVQSVSILMSNHYINQSNSSTWRSS